MSAEELNERIKELEEEVEYLRRVRWLYALLGAGCVIAGLYAVLLL